MVKKEGVKKKWGEMKNKEKREGIIVREGKRKGSR